MAILKIKDEKNNFINVPAIKGEKGEKGDKGDKGEAYTITDNDYTSIAGIVETNIQPTLDGVVEKSDVALEKSETALSISKGANQCKTYGDYPTFIEAFNLIPKDKYIVGQDIRIIQVNVPDLWVAYIEEESVEYTYTTDEDFINELVTNGIVQVGYYKFGMLETQKVDLTDYVKNTDYVTSSSPGIVKIGSGFGIWVNGNHQLYVSKATNTEIDKRVSNYTPIVPSNLDYAVKSVVGGHITLTRAEYDALETKDENTYYYIEEE